MGHKGLYYRSLSNFRTGPETWETPLTFIHSTPSPEFFILSFAYSVASYILFSNSICYGSSCCTFIHITDVVVSAWPYHRYPHSRWYLVHLFCNSCTPVPRMSFIIFHVTLLTEISFRISEIEVFLKWIWASFWEDLIDLMPFVLWSKSFNPSDVTQVYLLRCFNYP